MVLLDQNPLFFKNKKNLIFIDIDDEGAAFNVVKTLINMGHKKIAHIRHTRKRLSSIYRYEGYLKALKKFKGDLDLKYIAIGKGTEKGSYEATMEILNNSKNNLPSAIFAGTDLMAIYAIKAIQDFGLKVPDDISVVGYDNTYMAQYSSPPLSSVNVPIDDISQFAVENLIKLINQEEYVKEYKFETQLILRNSVKNLK